MEFERWVSVGYRIIKWDKLNAGSDVRGKKKPPKRLTGSQLIGQGFLIWLGKQATRRNHKKCKSGFRQKIKGQLTHLTRPIYWSILYVMNFSDPEQEAGKCLISDWRRDNKSTRIWMDKDSLTLQIQGRKRKRWLWILKGKEKNTLFRLGYDNLTEKFQKQKINRCMTW